MSQFCALSREQPFHHWLQTIVPDQHDILMKHLETSTSCKSNKLKMIEIQSKIKERGFLSSLINYLLLEYPEVIEIIEEGKKIQRGVPKIVMTNDNKVFRYYNPNLLSFPQKLIIKNVNVQALELSVLDFCKDKILTDYLIINNTAYIEYIKSKYYEEAKSVTDENRDLYQYRLRIGIASSVKILKQEQQT
jgi:hypothetical protein